MCDRHGCTEKGDCPAPKAPNSRDRWYFCQKHAAEYNRNWDYFEGLDKEEAEERAHRTARQRRLCRSAALWLGRQRRWHPQRDELRALEVLGLETDADFEDVKKAWRARAKEVHPDVRPGDAEAAKAFQACQLAYEVLRQAEERREWKG
jgi:hypothetical protein